MDPKAYRLPKQVFPRQYDVRIDARLGSEDFHGKVNIALDVKESSDTIELHSLELDLSDARLTVGGKNLEGEISTDDEREMASIHFEEPLPVGHANLEIAFRGKVSKNLEGLYLASDGSDECLCTQCEETDARKIFPCFDEPEFKARFAWNVTTSPDATVLANGPLLSVKESEDGRSKTWTFAPTRPMSSYLVALVIGDMASTPEEVVTGTPLRVWAVRGKEHMGRYAQDYARRLLPWYEEYFAAPYHYHKYDQVAVPGFSAGAMENSGLVIFRQEALLMNQDNVSWNQEKYIALVVAHEFAHMWFGNLVTMRWWDDLWLNEAFAEWMAYKVVDVLDPDYLVWHDFTSSSKAPTLEWDAMETTHSIYSPVETPAQATELFDRITYEKGCSVMRMLENFLGDKPFRDGLRTYMAEFRESNAAGADLWRHLQDASDQPVTRIMESWIKQGGFPAVAVSLEGSGGDTRLHLRQARHLAAPGASSDQTWEVPMVLRYEDGAGLHETRFLLRDRETTLPLSVSGKLKWCCANADNVGFYRVDLDETLLHGLLANVHKLTPPEQLGLIDDQWAMVRNGSRSMSTFLDTLAAMTSIPNYSVLDRVVAILHTISGLVEDTGDEAAISSFRKWVVKSFREQLDELGFEPREGEPQNDTQRRVFVLEAMTLLARDEKAIGEAVRHADREAVDPGSVDPNLASLFIRVAARFGDRERQDKHLRIFEERRDSDVSPQERNRYLFSLAEFNKPELISRTLQLIDEGVVPQESIGQLLSSPPISMMGRRASQPQCWDYLKENWELLREKLGDMWMGRLVEASGRLPAHLRGDIVSFFDATLDGYAEQSYARALETLDQRAEFAARTKDDLLSWLKT